ncbi:hypothetical protein GCM10010911_38440 [Paenibacillus nasutitermitis]|uniref:DUF2621 domain-containing protein n=2 Tax=Paenibacillus nasutitermitis TaxID=1652958 RepID=A0A916Z5H8_9BACL|nr:DUF2621 domain-containing protein [Paenibacillus nasutitermitis]GGD76654.1 hypothetical protein GCM10010911_38440 [Paenibacillus nasutitermitis]
MGNAPDWFMYFIVFWAFVLLGFMAIGGFFMFRKFLKVLPQRDGKSKLDWQNYWVDRSREMWPEDSKTFLERLVSPVPKAFRDIAKHSIAAKIAQVAVESGATEVTQNHCIEGYIRATPKRDYRSLVSFLEKQGIDYTPYKHLLNK